MTCRVAPLVALAVILQFAAISPLAAQKFPDSPVVTDVKPGDVPTPDPTPVNAPPPDPAPAPAPTATPTPADPPATPTVDAADLGESPVAAALASLGARFEPGETEEFTGLLDDLPDGVTGATLGHLLYARRHFDRAAWFFGYDATLDPDDPASLNNFAAMLLQTYEADPEGSDPTWLDAAYYAAARAADLAPDSAAIQNNLGNAARAMGLSEEAIAAGERATEFAADEALYWTNLARSRAAAGDTDGAARALACAHALDPNGPAVRFTATALPTVSAPYLQQLQNQCSVDFGCANICPGGIIGGLMRVTCEIESSSAQMACQAGEPYPTSYNCQEEFPEYGILIPGLNSGFSISLPGFSMHVLVDGDGTVRVRAEGGINRGRVGVYVGADGSYSPTNGASFDEYRGGVRVNILPSSAGGGGGADSTAGAWGHPPAHIEVEGSGSAPVTVGVETYNAGLISG